MHTAYVLPLHLRPSPLFCISFIRLVGTSKDWDSYTEYLDGNPNYQGNVSKSEQKPFEFSFGPTGAEWSRAKEEFETPTTSS